MFTLIFILYYIILVGDILTSLGLNLKSYERVIKVGDGPFKGSTATMVYLSAYEFKDLNGDKITHEGYFMTSHV